MIKRELHDLIDSLTTDIEFDYKGTHGAICPFSRTDISLSYGTEEKHFKKIDDAMSEKMFDGKSLDEISNDLDIY